ncbi:uncharacterized protein K452DRAFT_235856 [Aplosporella prunicola CBS 121167]|uniref:Phosducin domain-containing protein n=1 Tax=Aplosporella prunicola CBS 121167 TaxID=1176127 RepID=A0A6A6B037_9PEZI|nr:uncharacterized protein K452DRAFT_235856 [Aplosporella prunicola CBS 121167]KAF2137539.1 hypothetical protein K452DRAFT_235856 [Aplosporella prunicola CBS 121167]
MNAAQEEFDELFRDKDRNNRHPEDRQDSHSESDNDSTGQDDEKDIDSDFGDYDREDEDSSMRTRYTIPQARSEANTGPKGVIADAQAFEQAKKQRFNFLRKDPVPSRPRKNTKSEKSSVSDDDDEFMNRWRENRLKQLQSDPKRVVSRSRSRTDSPSQRMYGRLVTVDSDGYLEAIEQSPQSTTIVVFIYDDHSEISNMVEDCLRTLARRNGMVKFVKFHFEDAEMNVAGVPAILAYRGGEKFAGMVPVMDEIPDDAELNDVTLEVAMKK